MKRAKPPLQFMRVGLEPNQHGHAASQEHASSSLPDAFHCVFFSSATVTRLASNRNVAASGHRERMKTASFGYDRRSIPLGGFSRKGRALLFSGRGPTPVCLLLLSIPGGPPMVTERFEKKRGKKKKEKPHDPERT